jgi:hypothetical protein
MSVLLTSREYHMQTVYFFFFFSYRARQHICPGCTAAEGLLCNPKHYIQHRFSSPVPLIKRQRFLTEAVLISFGSTNGYPKTL